MTVRISFRPARCALLALRGLLLAASTLAPLAALAADLTFQIDGNTEYDTNAFRARGKAQDDVLFRFRPQVRLHEDRGQDLRYSLAYAVPFEFAVDHSKELDDVDHWADGSATYHVSDRLELFASDNFRYLRSALQNVRLGDVLAGEGNVLINQNRERTTLNDAEVGLSYQFTPRLAGEARVSHDFFKSDRRDRAQNWLLSGVADLSYVLTPRHSLGGGVRVNHQRFGERSNIPGSTVDAYNVFGQWIYRIDEKTSFSLTAGPSLLHSRQDSTDAARTVQAIPGLFIPAGSNLTGTGLLRPDGNPALGTLPEAGLVVSQLAGCTPLNPTTPLFTGSVCNIDNNVPGQQGVVVNPTDTPNEFTAATTATTIMDSAPSGQTDDTFDFFAEAVLRRDWSENLHSALRYTRSQEGASGLGGAVIQDYVQLANLWEFAERWQLAVRGDWSLRNSVVSSGVSQYVVAYDASVANGANFSGTTPAGAMSLVTLRGGNSNNIDTMRWGVAGRLTHDFTRNTSSWIQLTYNRQSSNQGTLGRTSDFDDFLAVVAVRHVFDPVKLW